MQLIHGGFPHSLLPLKFDQLLEEIDERPAVLCFSLGILIGIPERQHVPAESH
jgi:hypothetical protein